MPSSYPQSPLSQQQIFNMHVRGIGALERDLNKYIEDSGKIVGETIKAITKDIRIAAQERSPYLFGVLHGAHRDEYIGNIGRFGNFGRVYIDPEVVHPVLGGHPYDYGAKIHNFDRPWFLWTATEDAPDIIEKHGAELVGRFDQIFSGDDFYAGASPSFINEDLDLSRHNVLDWD